MARSNMGDRRKNKPRGSMDDKRTVQGGGRGRYLYEIDDWNLLGLKIADFQLPGVVVSDDRCGCCELSSWTFGSRSADESHTDWSKVFSACPESLRG